MKIITRLLGKKEEPSLDDVTARIIAATNAQLGRN